MTEKPEPISEDYSEDIRGLVDEMLQKDPKCRPTITDVLRKKFITVMIYPYFA